MVSRYILIGLGLLLLIEHVYGQPGAKVCRSVVAPVERNRGEDRSTGTNDLDQNLFIPVVVHIVYSTAQQNISNQQVYSQLQVLNDDFNRRNTDAANTLQAFQSVAANCKISFFLTEVDANGNSASGITRTLTSHGPFANDDIHYSSSGGYTAWDTKKFLNIWICDLSDGVFGYASFPGSNPETDGVVIDFQYIGTTGTVVSPFNKGRTTTHEVGHWLGLKHLWGDQGGCLDDDGVDDTLLQSGPSNGCNLSKSTCGSLDMVQNYMDLTPDDCMNFFTLGQKELMRQTLFLKRPDSWLDHSLVTGLDINQLDPVITIVPPNQLLIETTDPLISIKLFDVLGRALHYTITTSHVENRIIIQLGHEHEIVLLVFASRSEVICRRIKIL